MVHMFWKIELMQYHVSVKIKKGWLLIVLANYVNFSLA